jgi:membrane protein insertase Oxa1/YidC/SpoIIIJ
LVSGAVFTILQTCAIIKKSLPESRGQRCTTTYIRIKNRQTNNKEKKGGKREDKPRLKPDIATESN